jgi:CheY-like chemotaxis protein
MRAMSGKRIIIVDDNADAADSVAVLLECEGHEVRIAHNGLDALMEARRWRPDAMVLDLGLPDMHGCEVARQVVALQLDPPPMLVALSGYGRPEDVREARDAGFAHHVLKPADPDALFALFNAHALG